MKIRRFMKNYEQQLLKQLNAPLSPEEARRLQTRHQRLIARMQHERLIHLLITLFFALFTLITLCLVIFHPSLSVFVLLGLFLTLLIPYIFHYYFLENTVQRWYDLGDRIAKMEKNRSHDESYDN